jgi:hypothetical protein
MVSAPSTGKVNMHGKSLTSEEAITAYFRALPRHYGARRNLSQASQYYSWHSSQVTSEYMTFYSYTNLIGVNWKGSNISLYVTQLYGNFPRNMFVYLTTVPTVKFTEEK